MQSMSHRGKSTDNAPIESFFGHFKCGVAYEDCNNITDLKAIVDDYMLYYNYERPQMHKQKMTPHEVECHLMCI
ncbi:IS3 family transposase [Mollicutes bacterium LVI A0078]|nr:IS3 family transposase [Mollicutes bacterium LVI A0078]